VQTLPIPLMLRSMKSTQISRRTVATATNPPY
jgi:hypothetical protein